MPHRFDVDLPRRLWRDATAMLEGAEGATVARCAEHPDVPARVTPCERCGAFACEACFDTPSSELCAACRLRTAKIPWEDRSLGGTSRLWNTLTAMWSEPRATFRAIGVGDLGPGFSFFAITLAVGYAPLIACLPLAAGLLAIMGQEVDDGPFAAEGMLALLLGTILLIPIYFVFIHGLVTAFWVVAFHVGARVLGGKGSISGALRAVLYTGGAHPLNAVIILFAFIPLIGTIFNLGGQIAKLVWTGFALTGSAESVYGLKDDRALLAGFFPSALAVLLLVGFCVLGVGLAWATSPR